MTSANEIPSALVRCQDRLLTRIRWMMGEPARRTADSMDFLGEVAARVLEQQDRLECRNEAHFLALATRMARNIIIDRVRNARVIQFESFASGLSLGGVKDGDGATPSQQVVAREQVELVFEAMESLSEDDQRVIELRDFDQLPFKEVAARLGRSENAATVLHGRAISRVGRWLRRHRGAE